MPHRMFNVMCKKSIFEKVRVKVFLFVYLRNFRFSHYITWNGIVDRQIVRGESERNGERVEDKTRVLIKNEERLAV